MSTLNDGTDKIRLAELRALQTKKTAALGKYPIFGKTRDVNVSKADIEKLVLKHYPKAIPGSCVIDKVTGGTAAHGTMYQGFRMEQAGDDYISGSVSILLESWGDSIRCVAWVNIDG